MRRAIYLSLLFAIIGISMANSQVSDTASRRDKPPIPEEARKLFKLPKGIRIELVAAEPAIESPVAMAFDEKDRLWVVEMPDYPNGPAKGEKPGGRIKILEDKDEHGVYRKSRIFADNLLFANGIMPWMDGVIVTAAPHILWLRDTKGTGKADTREVLWEGFAEGNPQLRVSHPVLGLDGWIYVANGLRGGIVMRPKDAKDKAINLSGMDFRFKPDSGEGEAVTGMGQFGNCFDDWGQRFVCDNRHHLRHVVIEQRYLRRNPFVVVPKVVEDISILEDGPLSSGGKVYPLSKNWTTSSLHEGRFTAACGVHIFRGTGLPKELHGAAFTCEPTGNLVHAEILKPRGATFEARPFKDKVEFLASPDDWFRPVFLAGGPDGALYVVDMCRAVIEHPEFMPPELQKRPDLTLGKDRGRIWRIVAQGHKPRNVRPERLTAKDWVAQLENPDGWWRTTAHRLLIEKTEQEMYPPLHALVNDSKNPLARIHAAWILQRRDNLKPAQIVALLQDPDPRLRHQGVLLAEKVIHYVDEVRQPILRMDADADARVRFQAALTMGFANVRRSDCVVRFLLRDTGDPWTRWAAGSSLGEGAVAEALTLLLKGKDRLTKLAAGPRRDMLRELAAQLGATKDFQIISILNELGAWGEVLLVQLAVIDGLGEGLARKNLTIEKLTDAYNQVAAQPVTRHLEWLRELLQKVAELARDEKAELPDRLTAIRLMGQANWRLADKTLAPLLEDPIQEVRLAAVRSLAQRSENEAAVVLIKSWPGYTPSIRREVIEAMLRTPYRVVTLLEEIDAKRIKPAEVDATRTRQLLNHDSPDIRARAQKLLRDNLPADRKDVLAKYKPALTTKGDPKRGLEIFKKNCATCHRVAGHGTDVGPDIADTRTKTLEALLVDILNPNQAIDSNYLNYLVNTKDGRSFTGMLAAETAGNITLKRAEGQTDVLLRRDIESIESTGGSLMPDGLEKAISVAEMADLLRFLKNWRYLNGAAPLGE